MTLVDSSAVATYRERHDWNQLRSNMGLIKPFATSSVRPHELPAAFRSSSCKVGLVTSSPRWYAEEILKTFAVPYDVLVTGSDGFPAKPNPATLVEAVKQAGGVVTHSFYVGDDAKDFEACVLAKIHSVGAGWGITDFESVSRYAPDLLVAEPADFLALVQNGAGNGGYAGEAGYGSRPPHTHRGSVLPCARTPYITYALGRYFPKADHRHASSPLSRDVLAHKEHDGPAAALGAALARAIPTLGWMPTNIVHVPPKPSQESLPRRRFRELLRVAQASFGGAVTVTEDGLQCVKEVTGYKQMNPTQRAAAIKGVFATKYNWSSVPRVLLVDDVYTTGETVLECARTLTAAGAADVRILAIAKDQHTLLTRDCPTCHSRMVVRANRMGVQFWGCTAWRPDGSGCTTTISM